MLLAVFMVIVVNDFQTYDDFVKNTNFGNIINELKKESLSYGSSNN
jgi:hypothetical protein